MHERERERERDVHTELNSLQNVLVCDVFVHTDCKDVSKWIFLSVQKNTHKTLKNLMPQKKKKVSARVCFVIIFHKHS